MAGFLKIGDIKGQATDAEHKEWIELISVGQSIDRPIVSGSSVSVGAAAAHCGPIEVSKRLDKSTPKLSEAICDGKRYDEVLIHLTTQTGAGKSVPYYAIKLTNAVVIEHRLNAQADPSMGDTETMSLDYEKIEWKFTQFGENGKKMGDVSATWNVRDQTP